MAAVAAVLPVTAAMGTACSGDDRPPSAPAGGSASALAPKPTFAPDSTMAKIVQKGKLVVGVKYDQPGFGLLDPVKNRPDGFDVAVAKEVGRALGLQENQVELVEAVSANRVPYLQEDRVDLVVATMTINDDRKQQVDFSRPYYQAGQSILVKKENTDIKSVTDLNGKKVCSVQGSTSEKTVKERAPQSELLSLTGYAACVTSLKDGRVAAVSTDDIILAGFAAADPALKLVGGQFTKEPYGIGVKKGKADLVRFLDQVIAGMLSDGRWDRIYDTYLGRVEGLPKAADARALIPAN